MGHFFLSLSFSTQQKGGPWWKLAHSICQVCGWFDNAAAAPLCTPPSFLASLSRGTPSHLLLVLFS